MDPNAIKLISPLTKRLVAPNRANIKKVAASVFYPHLDYNWQDAIQKEINNDKNKKKTPIQLNWIIPESYRLIHDTPEEAQIYKNVTRSSHRVYYIAVGSRDFIINQWVPSMTREWHPSGYGTVWNEIKEYGDGNGIGNIMVTLSHSHSCD